MAKQLRITGLVQGVGYRYNFHAQARALNLTGWVRNRLDGSVEASVSGSDPALEKIVEWARRGPPGARVTEVLIAETDDTPKPQGEFEIWPTA
ncbi:MAG: acylphosphatase [Rhodospirillales bacterium RIFCSPLOWO2_12_FULL_67_15]|nr:MAG: acylphosphatase [Rhodospirillales bacterium RIFCSPLOWO2_12_FULL_67_15]